MGVTEIGVVILETVATAVDTLNHFVLHTRVKMNNYLHEK